MLAVKLHGWNYMAVLEEPPRNNKGFEHFYGLFARWLDCLALPWLPRLRLDPSQGAARNPLARSPMRQALVTLARHCGTSDLGLDFGAVRD